MQPMGCDDHEAPAETTLERTVDVPADADAVWDEIIDGSWLGADELDARPGGVVHVDDESGVRFGVVEEVEPARRLTFWWAGDDDAPPSYVELVLEPLGDGTRIRVRESLVDADRMLARVGRGPFALARV